MLICNGFSFGCVLVLLLLMLPLTQSLCTQCSYLCAVLFFSFLFLLFVAFSPLFFPFWYAPAIMFTCSLDFVQFVCSPCLLLFIFNMYLIFYGVIVVVFFSSLDAEQVNEREEIKNNTPCAFYVEMHLCRKCRKK